MKNITHNLWSKYAITFYNKMKSDHCKDCNTYVYAYTQRKFLIHDIIILQYSNIWRVN